MLIVVRLVVTVGNVSIIMSCIDSHGAAVATLVAMVGELRCLVSNKILSFTKILMLI